MTTAQSIKSQKGFTLIELLVVIGILAILLAIVLIAINPARQFAQANNTKRNSDVQTLLNAIHQYAADNAGSLPQGLRVPTDITAGTTYAISSNATVVINGITYTGLGATNGPAFCLALVNKYVAALPQDPLSNNGANITESQCSGTWNTGYVASVSATNSRTTISAPQAQLGVTIDLTR